jgi:hypothetical protein
MPTNETQGPIEVGLFGLQDIVKLEIALGQLVQHPAGLENQCAASGVFCIHLYLYRIRDNNMSANDFLTMVGLRYSVG